MLAYPRQSNSDPMISPGISTEHEPPVATIENAGVSAATGGLPLGGRDRTFGSRKGFRTIPIMGTMAQRVVQLPGSSDCVSAHAADACDGVIRMRRCTMGWYTARHSARASRALFARRLPARFLCSRRCDPEAAFGVESHHFFDFRRVRRCSFSACAHDQVSGS